MTHRTLTRRLHVLLLQPRARLASSSLPLRPQPAAGLAVAAALLAAAALPAQTLPSQTLPYINPSAGTVVNPRSFPVNVLLVHLTPAGAVDAQQIVRLDPNASAPITVPPTSVLMFVPLDPTVGKKRPPDCPASAGGMHLTAALVHEELGIHDRATRDKSDAEEKVGLQKGAIQFEQYMDEATTQRNDPLQAELRSQQERNMTPQQANLAQQQDLQNAEVGAMQDVMMYAFSNSDAIDAHNSNSDAEATELQGMIDSKREYIAKLETGFRNHEALVDAERRFNSDSTHLLEATHPPETFDLPKDAVFGRACGGPANDRDFVALKFAAPPEVKLLFGKAHFDHEGDEDLIFNRIGDTPQFVATLYWPLQAQRAAVQIREQSHWKRAGEVEAGRPSIGKAIAQQKKTIGPLKRARRDAAFAANGGDEIKTAILP